MTISVPLQLHPDSNSEGLEGIKVEIQRLRPRRLLLRFIVEGDVRQINFAPHMRDERRDELWRHTCFEAFIRVDDEPSYLEFNLAADGWNCYHFDDYRAGMEPARIGEPRIEGLRKLKALAPGTRAHLTDLDTLDAYRAPFLILQAHLELERRPELWVDRPWHLGLSAVIEQRNGSRSYWALRHPPGTPDFHHPDCFALELAPARPA